MKKDESKKSNQPVEGEGSYSATRRYNQHLGDAIDSTDLEAGAEAARLAMEGPEREALERAAAKAKKGPLHRPQGRSPAPQTRPKATK
jgi:hypothetical protein